MFNLCALALIMCCAVFGVVTAYPQNAQGNNVPAQQSKVARAASPAADSRYYRPGFGGTGFGRPGFGGAGPGGSGFGRPGFTGSGFGEPGFGGSGFGRPGYWQPSGSFSNANANSFNTAFQTPFGGFSLSSSNSFGGSTNYGRK